MKKEKIFLKWLGGKRKELPIINKVIDKLDINNYYEPFLGGGSSLLNILDKKNINKAYLNDNFKSLIDAYKFSKDKNLDYLKKLNEFQIIFDNSNIDFYNLNDEYEKLKLNSKRKVDTTLKKIVIYTYIRNIYNTTKDEIIKAASLIFIRKYAFSGMFRYNKSGYFNVPYGGTGYDKNSLINRNLYFKNYNFDKCEFFNLDYKEFFNQQYFIKNDLIFIDPPYDESFDNYNNSTFDKQEQENLYENLMVLKNKCNILAIMKGTPFILDLYKDFDIISYDFQYNVNFKNRNKQNFQHILLKNF